MVLKKKTHILTAYELFAEKGKILLMIFAPRLLNKMNTCAKIIV